MATNTRVLFVDDEPLLHDVIQRLLTRRGIEVSGCLSATEAVEVLKKETFTLVLTDFKMPDMDGLELLSYVRQHHPQTHVIMLTAHATVQHAVRAMRSGAIDYIPKPFATAELVDRIEKHLKQAATEAEAPAAAKASSRKRSGSKRVDYIGEHASILAIKEMLPLISRNRAPVFIRGESGTGKEILARLIHETSDRADGPYVTLNCANLPRELVESHLFGHRKGAFTGAIEDMVGAFERADGGTLLLDEITEVDLSVQAKLLRVLQEQEIQRVGESTTRKVNVRVIATSNRDLREAMQQKAFREDLYHRLSVFPLNVPPLRQRASDIPLLAKHFVTKYSTLYSLPQKTISMSLMRYLQQQAWPGNVRQLENAIQRGVLFSASRTVIELEDVRNDFFDDAATVVANPAATTAFDRSLTTLEAMERSMILQALKDAGNNQEVAAERLGISARTIRNKLKKYREEGVEA